MARMLRFYGASDDLFEIEGTRKGEPDEIGCWHRQAIVKVKADDDAGLYVFGTYAPGDVACWVIGIMNLDDGIDIPIWPMRFETSERKYSPVLVIEAPDDAVVSMNEDDD